MSGPATPTDTAQVEEVPVFTAAGARHRRKTTEIRSYDFRQSGFLAPSELRKIRLRHEQFVRSLAARLAIFLRLEFSLQLQRVQIIGYQKLVDSLVSPAHIALFKADPLKGVGLLVIPPKLSLAMVERLLGGSGQIPEAGRDLSEIEVALINQVSSLTLSEWCNHWPEMREVRTALLGHENNSKYLQTAPPDTSMLVFTIVGGVGEQNETMQLAFPYATIEPLVRLLSPTLPESEPAPAPGGKPKWSQEFDNVKVPLTAEWQGLTMSAGEMARLKCGDVLMLDASCAAQVQLRLSLIPKFTGRPGTCEGKWAVQLTGTL